MLIVAAAEYSLVYLLAGGGLVGAALIYFVAKALGRYRGATGHCQAYEALGIDTAQGECQS